MYLAIAILTYFKLFYITNCMCLSFIYDICDRVLLAWHYNSAEVHFSLRLNC